MKWNFGNIESHIGHFLNLKCWRDGCRKIMMVNIWELWKGWVHNNAQDSLVDPKHLVLIIVFKKNLHGGISIKSFEILKYFDNLETFVNPSKLEMLSNNFDIVR